MSRGIPKNERTNNVVKVVEEMRFPGEIERPFGLPETCSDQELIEAVLASMLGADLDSLAPLLHVPPNAVRHWVGTKEWSALKSQVSPAFKSMVHTELCSLRSLSLLKLRERLRDGDVAVDRQGSPITKLVANDEGEPTEVNVTVPVSAANVAKILIATQSVLHELERDLGVVRDEKGDISQEELMVALKRYAQAKEVTGTSERVN